MFKSKTIIGNLGKKVYFWHPLSVFSEKIFNSTLYSVVYSNLVKTKAKRFAKSPVFIDIETTNFCNAKCIMCPNPFLRRKKGIMSMKLFTDIIDKIAREYPNVERICLSWLGEPLCDPHIFKRIEYIKKRIPNQKVKFFTNASLLDRKKIKKLFASGLDSLTISFNGLNKETYEKVMGLDYQRTMRNINHLLEERARRGVKKPEIILSCMRLKENEKEVNKFKKKWQSLVDSVIVRAPMNWGGGIKLKRAHYLPNLNRNWPCLFPFQTMIISWGGKAVICCMDAEASVTYGDSRKSSLKKIWEGKPHKKITQAHSEGRGDKIAVCKNCDGLVRGVTRWWFV